MVSAAPIIAGITFIFTFHVLIITVAVAVVVVSIKQPYFT
jgi:hypothetical protein